MDPNSSDSRSANAPHRPRRPCSRHLQSRYALPHLTTQQHNPHPFSSLTPNSHPTGGIGFIGAGTDVSDLASHLDEASSQLETAGLHTLNGTLPVGIGGAFRDQVIGTAILLFVILAVGDVRNTTPGVNLAPLIVGLIVVAIGFAWGTNAGYAINPARDLGPRLFHAVAPIRHKGGSDWGYAWVPIVGPLVGAVLAGLAAPLFG